MNNKISYEEISIHDVDSIKTLWLDQCAYHASISKHFSDKFKNLEFDYRKKTLMKHEIIQIIVAKHDINPIGYIISLIDQNNIGEVFSLYVQPTYRNQHIGEQLMEQSIAWLESKDLKAVQLSVAVGNEHVLNFYKKFDFYPYTILLEKKGSE